MKVPFNQRKQYQSSEQWIFEPLSDEPVLTQLHSQSKLIVINFSVENTHS
jgi:hypothetical protein